MDNNSSQTIRKMVTKTGLDYVTLGIQIGASEKSIYKWMNGTSKPSCDHLLRLISLLISGSNERLE